MNSTRLRFLLLSLFVLSISTQSNAQSQKIATSGEIFNALEKFGVCANVLYVAAHPDDENTRMISFLSNEVKANTRYLSLTRMSFGRYENFDQM